MSPGAIDEPIRIFVSYARKDRRWLDEDNPHNLIPWLIDSLRKHNVVFWFDQDLVPSEVYSQRISDEIARADIALLMVSQRFLNSVYIEQNELPPIKERARQGTLAVLPILLERCAWEEDEFLNARQMLPGKPTPLIKYVDNDAEWADVRYELLDGIKMLIRNIRTARLQGGTLPAGPVPPAAAGAESPAPEPPPAPAERPFAPAPTAEAWDAGAAAGQFCVLELESDPPGADVVIDGGAFEAKTPGKIKRVPQGRHHYDAVLEGERRLSYFDIRDFACRVLIEFPQAKQRRADQEAENAFWERTAQTGTEEGYAAYLAGSRLGLHRAEAEGRMAELVAERARREEEERKRIEKEAAAERARQAAERKEEALWAAAREADSEEAYAGYLESSRLLAHRDEAVRRAAELAAERERKQAERREAALWRKASGEDTEESYAAYLKASALLSSKPQALARIGELRAERVRKEEEKARKRREREAAAKAAREEELRQQTLLRERQEREALEKARKEAEALAARKAEEQRQAELKRQREAELAREKARREAEAAKRAAEAREAERLRRLEEERERERIEAEAQKRRAEQIARQQKEEAAAAAALKEQQRKQEELRRKREEEARAQARLPKLVSFIRPLDVSADEPRVAPAAVSGRSFGSWFKGLLAPAPSPARRVAKREWGRNILDAMAKVEARRADAEKEMQTVLGSMLKIEAREVEMQALTDEQVRAKVTELRTRLARGATPDEILVDAFAAVMSACRRLSGCAITAGDDKLTWKYFPTVDQLACAIAMMQRKVTEAPAEAEHRMAVLAPACMQALAGRGVHVVAATDEKAAQDAHLAAVVHGYLGLSVGCLRPDQATDERRAQYACDITFGSVAEFCADHLRDSMARRPEDQVQRGLYAAIVCDADSILIDEAFTSRTISRLAIAAPGESPHARLKPAVEALVRAQEKALAARTEDLFFVVDERARTVALTDKGRRALGVADDDLDAAAVLLRAYGLYRRNVDYVVEDNRVVVIDSSTGRRLKGCRWSDGLQQALEAKEDVAVEVERETLRSITHRSYFRQYTALAGMAPVVEPDATSYSDLYTLGAFVIPPGQEDAPQAEGNSIYRTQREKYNAAIEEIVQSRQKGQPVLVCAPSIEVAEFMSRLLRRKAVPHSALTVWIPDDQVETIRMRAGMKGAVTVATGIVTFGPGIEVDAGDGVGGLHLVVLERHPVRRVDLRWLRLPGVGSSHFFMSLEDDLLRGADPRRIAQILGGAATVEGEELKQEPLRQLVEEAQKEAGEAFSRARQREAGFDDVLHDHREAMRREYAAAVVGGVDRGQLLEKVSALIAAKARQCLAGGSGGVAGFSAWVEAQFPVAFKPSAPSDAETLARTVVEGVRKAYQLKSAVEKPEDLAAIERHLYFEAVDSRWGAYLREVDKLRAAAGDPAGARRVAPEEFARRAAGAFDSFRQGVVEDIASRMFRVVTKTSWDAVAAISSSVSSTPSVAVPSRRDVPRVGRNEPCPCGSGKKFKACCGREG